jgi:hypothetical protein
MQVEQIDTVITINEYDQYSVSSHPSATSCNKGLDRVLLERNIEKLLERREQPMGSTSRMFVEENYCQENYGQSSQINKLLNQDRCREPLDLTDVGLSLDNLSPRTKMTYMTPQHVIKKDPMITSSMPELPHYEILRFDDITPINEELPTPDISELSMKNLPEPSNPIGE